MADRARRAEARAQRQQEAAEAVVAGQENENKEDSDDNEEMEEVPVRVPARRARNPAVVPQLAVDPGMWMNMVNVKPPYLPDLEIESMKKFILEYKKIFSEVSASIIAQYAAIYLGRSHGNDCERKWTRI